MDVGISSTFSHNFRRSEYSCRHFYIIGKLDPFGIDWDFLKDDITVFDVLFDFFNVLFCMLSYDAFECQEC